MSGKLLGIIGLVILGLYGSAATAAPVVSLNCNGCTLAQEEQRALAYPGYTPRFVHNYQRHSIRKFIVYLDVPGRGFITNAVPVEPQPAAGGREVTPTGVAVRTLWEMSVDPDVTAIFRELDRLYTADPSSFSKVYRIDMDRAGLTQGDIAPRNFDPRMIAWEHPGGESFRFLERLNSLFASHSGTQQISNRLADLIHGVSIPATGAYIEGGTGGGTVGVNFGDVPQEYVVDFCNDDGQCTRVKLTISTQGIKSEFVSSRDALDVTYPTEQERPLRRSWNGAGWDSARDMAVFAADRTGGSVTVTGGPVCRRVILSCVDAGPVYQCQVYCVNN